MPIQDLPLDDQPCGEYFEMPMSSAEKTALRIANLEHAIKTQALNAKLTQALTFAENLRDFFAAQQNAYLKQVMQDPHNRELCDVLGHQSSAITRAQQIAGILLYNYLWALQEEVADMLKHEAPNEHWLEIAELIRDLNLDSKQSHRDIPQ